MAEKRRSPRPPPPAKKARATKAAKGTPATRGRPPAAKDTRARVRRSPEESRRLLLAAAEELVVARGPDGLTLQGVARAAGVSHALVTHYFGTFEALLGEVIGVRNQRIANEIRAQLQAGEGPVSARDMLERFFSVLRDNGHTRLVAWALLTGRVDGLPLIKMQGLKLVGDAVEERAGRDAQARGVSPPARDHVDLALLVGLCASMWFTLAGDYLLQSVGRSADDETERWFKDGLAGLLDGALASSLRQPSALPERPKR